MDALIVGIIVVAAAGYVITRMCKSVRSKSCGACANCARTNDRCGIGTSFRQGK